MSHRSYLIAVAMAASLAATPAAAAGPAQSAPARALLLLPLTLTKVDDLNFGTIVSSPVAGTVTINASTGVRTHAGGVTEIASAAGQRALFAWAGTPSQQVNFDIAYPATLDNGAGDSVQVALLYLQSDSMIADSSGVVQVGVGGSILISANQAEGIYSNTFTVTANYP